MKKSLIVAAIHLGIVLAVWANYSVERQTLPRAWAKTAPYDPYDILRGRYISLRVLALTEIAAGQSRNWEGELFARDGLLHLRESGCCVTYSHDPRTNLTSLTKSISYFIPENAVDPSRLKPGEELWVELSIPKHGMPRPLQLALKKAGGSWHPLNF